MNGVVVATLLLLGGCVRVGFDTTGSGGESSGDRARADGPFGDFAVPEGPPGIVASSDTGLDTLSTWIDITHGTFSMGSPATEPCLYVDERQHQVVLSHDFEVQRFEVTQQQFLSRMGYNPSEFTSCGTSCPVEQVSWNEAAAYCNRLSEEHGRSPCYSCSGVGADVTCGATAAYSGQRIYDCPGFRLPTEAEWEYSYRAGTLTAYYNAGNDAKTCASCTSLDVNADAIGWYCANSGGRPHPVGQKQPNAWGLHDMAGNVWEWCHDWYAGSLGSAAVTDPWGSAASHAGHVLRGGSWATKSFDLRAANRHGTFKKSNNVGFRCVRTRH
jgi:formylglycine-generating enzyme required for sulfatase activity